MKLEDSPLEVMLDRLLDEAMLVLALTDNMEDPPMFESFVFSL